MVTITPQLSQFKSEYESARRWRRTRPEPLQFNDVRWGAFDRFLSLGLPTTDDPEWPFTDISSLSEKFFSLAIESSNGASHIDIAPFRLAENSGMELIFVDGYHLPSASKFRDLPAGARVCSLSEMLDSHPSEIEPHLARIAAHGRQAFVALNTSLFMDGACILIPAKETLKDPIHLCFVSTGKADREPAMSHPRILVVLEDASQATIVESYVGPKGIQYLTNSVAEIVLGENATLEHYKLQRESTEAYHISSTFLIAQSRAKYSGHSISLGGGLTRNESVAALRGERARYGLNTLYLIDGERLIDNQTTIHHGARGSISQHVCNGFVADHAKSVSGSKIGITADANPSEVSRTARSLLFTRDAQMHSSSHVENLTDEFSFCESATRRHVDDDDAGHETAAAKNEKRRRTVEDSIAEMLSPMPFHAFRATVDRLLRQQLHEVLNRLD